MGASPGHHQRSVVADGAAWAANVSCAVTIVFVNKVLMDPTRGYAFTFACTLSAIHFLTAAACVMGAQSLGLAQKQSLPWKPTLVFSLVAVVSIASLNLSLLVNPVGLYQVAKLLVIPFVCGVEAAWLGRRFNGATLCAIATVVVGVAVVTINDLGSGSTSLLGVVVAGVSVVGSGMQQILCGTMQKTYKLQSHQLLAATAPVQGGLLLLVGPWVDAAVSGTWVGHYTLSTPAAAVLVASCAISVGVNVSQFACLGRFSAVTFQVLGHTKTILVLLISWGALGESMSGRKLAGMAVAVGGMIAYGLSVNAATTSPQSSKSLAKSSSSGSSSSSAAKVSKPGGAASSGGSGAADGAGGLLEMGSSRKGGGHKGVLGGGDVEGGESENVPLLRNVSGGSAWAGESVMVVAVDHSSSSSTRDAKQAGR